MSKLRIYVCVVLGVGVLLSFVWFRPSPEAPPKGVMPFETASVESGAVQETNSVSAEKDGAVATLSTNSTPLSDNVYAPVSRADIVYVDNGFEPDDDAPVPSLEEQVRNNRVVARVAFAEEDIKVERRGDYDTISVPDAMGGMAVPGSPDLPIYSFTLLIPRGRVVDDMQFKVSEVPWKEGVYVAPTQPPQKPDGSAPLPFVPPDETFYARDEFMPEVVVKGSGAQGIRGYRVVPIYVYPVRYNPAAGTLTRVVSMRVELTTRDMTAEELKNAFMPRSNQHFDASVKAIVTNPGIMDIQIEQK